jgi:hypothetical protein
MDSNTLHKRNKTYQQHELQKLVAMLCDMYAARKQDNNLILLLRAMPLLI